MRVLVTGAGGFIGSHLVEALAAAGAEVTALLRYTATRHLGNLAGSACLAQVRIAFGDVRDSDQMQRMVEGHDTIVHAAALIGIPYSYEAPRSTLDTNVTGTLNLLEAARRLGVRRFVHLSSSEVYGSALSVPITEDHKLQAQSPYAATKIAAEAMVEAWRRNHGVPAVILRPFNTYGPRQSRRAIIPTIIGQARAGGPVRLGTLTPVRDFVYVSDTVAGIVAAATAERIGPGPYNLGTGIGRSMADVVALIGWQFGKTLTIEPDPARLRPPEGEVDRLIAASGAFREATGWQPRVAFAEGLARTIAAFGEPDDGSYVV